MRNGTKKMLAARIAIAVAIVIVVLAAVPMWHRVLDVNALTVSKAEANSSNPYLYYPHPGFELWEVFPHVR